MRQIIDTYQSYEELSAHERIGIDYRILHERKGDQLLVLSPHAGGIESGVSELIHEISSDYSMYLFEGLKVKGNHVLHITSTRFDEVGLPFTGAYPSLYVCTPWLWRNRGASNVSGRYGQRKSGRNCETSNAKWLSRIAAI